MRTPFLVVPAPGKAVGTEARFVSCPVAASLRVEIAQNDKNIPGGTPPNNRVEFMVEIFLVSQYITFQFY